ncbi:MAG: SRPBCC family protein [Kofleriaceae bacterium]
MRRGSVTATIPASAAAVFALVHDYGRRLEWDTLLRAAYLEPGHPVAAKGAISVCVGRRTLGGLALRTRYVAFDPPKVAAVEMINAPPLFATWAASIRHVELGPDESRITYTFHFRARPRWLAWLFEPIMLVMFRWETRKRLRALSAHFQR